MEEKINKLHKMIEEIFPEALTVKIFVNCEGIKATPEYKTNLPNGCSMMNIAGKWIKKRASK